MLKRILSLTLSALLLIGAAPAALAEPALPEAVSAQMLSADFWCALSANSGALVMERQEIDHFNSVNRAKIELGGQYFALTDIQSLTDGAFVRHLIESLSLPDNCEQLYVNGVVQPRPYWDAIMSARALEAVPDVVRVSFGYSVRRDDLRLFPTGDFAGVTNTEKLYDKLVMSEYMPYLPLAVLHESADGLWYFVVMYGFAGWIEKEAVALCASREEWLGRMQPTDFLVVTGRELTLPEEPYCPDVSGLTLPMGTVLPLALEEEAPEVIHRRRGYGCYTLRLPTRGEDGYIRDEYAFLPITEDVHRGYMDFTLENELELAFKFLGDRYGWAGMFSANDCSGLIHQVFACFGMELPRMASAIMELPGLTALDLSGYDSAGRLSGLATIPAGSLLGLPGHIMIYLGSVGGNAYVLSSTGSFGPSQLPDGYDSSVNTVCVNSLAHTRRRSGPTWLESLDSLIIFS